MIKNLIIFILSIIIYIIYKSNIEESFINIEKSVINITDFIYYDENNNVIDNTKHEYEEQLMALQYIEPNDVVLELGARYGSVSVLTSKIVENKGKLVVVEPDETIIPALEKNKKINKADFEILNKFISNKNKKIIHDGYGTRLVDTETNEPNDNHISYAEFKKLYPYKFNVLIADCEGCLEEFIEMLGDDINNYNKILFEADQEHICDYEAILNKLQKRGFKLIDSRIGLVNAILNKIQKLGFNTKRSILKKFVANRYYLKKI